MRALFTRFVIFFLIAIAASSTLQAADTATVLQPMFAACSLDQQASWVDAKLASPLTAKERSAYRALRAALVQMRQVHLELRSQHPLIDLHGHRHTHQA